MKTIEIQEEITQYGNIILPSFILENMCIDIDDTVKVTYFTKQANESVNAYGQSFIGKDGCKSINKPTKENEQLEIFLPYVLLESAGLSIDGYLDIYCIPGSIIIGSVDPLSAVPPSLMELFDNLGISHEVIRKVLKEGGI